MLTTEEEAVADEPELGELEALTGVRQFPMRVKCATLSWHALRAALQDEATEQVSTE
jgi:nitrogen fixation NifU-like protein